MSKLSIFTCFCIIICVVYCAKNDKTNFKWPTVGISVLIRNKADTLPYFFSCLLNLEYPKDRMYIWIYSDLNEDNSIEIIQEWVKMYGSKYNSIHVTTNSSRGQYNLMAQISNWSAEHFKHIIKLREDALIFSRKMWADFVFMLDADVFLTEPATLKILVNKGESIVAPMLISDGFYSNFWLAFENMSMPIKLSNKLYT